MSEYQASGDAAVQSNFFDPGCAACGAVLTVMGFISQDIYPALGVIALLLSISASGLSIYRFFRYPLKRHEEDE